MIEHYAFGQMTIDGTIYRADLLIFPDGRVRADWWREEGHRLCLDDVSDLLATEPELLVVGTGASGLMKTEPELERRLREANIELRTAPSAEAAAVYNEQTPNRKVAACFHLTC